MGGTEPELSVPVLGDAPAAVPGAHSRAPLGHARAAGREAGPRSGADAGHGRSRAQDDLVAPGRRARRHGPAQGCRPGAGGSLGDLDGVRLGPGRGLPRLRRKAREHGPPRHELPELGARLPLPRRLHRLLRPESELRVLPWLRPPARGHAHGPVAAWVRHPVGLARERLGTAPGALGRARCAPPRHPGAHLDHRPPPRAAGVEPRPHPVPDLRRDRRRERRVPAAGWRTTSGGSGAHACPCPSTRSRDGEGSPHGSCGGWWRDLRARGIRTLLYLRSFVADDIAGTEQPGVLRARRGPRIRGHDAGRRALPAALAFSRRPGRRGGLHEPRRAGVVGQAGDPAAGHGRPRLHERLRRAGAAGHALSRRVDRCSPCTTATRCSRPA